MTRTPIAENCLHVLGASEHDLELLNALVERIQPTARKYSDSSRQRYPSEGEPTEEGELATYAYQVANCIVRQWVSLLYQVTEKGRVPLDPSLLPYTFATRNRLNLFWNSLHHLTLSKEETRAVLHSLYEQTKPHPVQLPFNIQLSVAACRIWAERTNPQEAPK